MEILAKDNKETLSEHVLLCLQAAKSIVPSLPLIEEEKQQLLDDLCLGLALHDVGKAAIGFQRVMLGQSKNWKGKRHEILSASFASSIPDISEAVIFAILTHHKSIPNTFFEEEKKALDFNSLPIGEQATRRPFWRKMREEWYENYESFRESWVKICKYIHREDLIDMNVLAPLKLDVCWLERDDTEFGQIRKKDFLQRRYFSLLRGLLITCDHMASGHYIPKEQSFTLNASISLTHNIRHLRGFQIEMSQTKGSVILRAPTGSGKTEAALIWAAHNKEEYSRLYYVLPNIASINAMFKRLQSLYGDHSVGLLHSRSRSAIYNTLASGEDIESKLKNQQTANMLSNLVHAIYFPIRVCTPHQVLRFSLRGKGWETMLAEFPQGLFIFDEIHAYDPRLVGQILATANLVSRWGGKCAFLSATMPSFLLELIKEKLTEDSDSPGNPPPRFISPHREVDKDILELKRHLLKWKEGRIVDYLSDIIGDMEKGLKVLVVCNTISASQVVFQELHSLLKKKYDKNSLGHKLMLIHSRFSRMDRTKKEFQIINTSTQPSILVSTQVVEVSLDISYDVAYLEPAPIDAIIQRMGRVNRKGDKEKVATIYLVSEEISEHSVYKNQERIKRSIKELSNLADTGFTVGESELVQAADHVYEYGFTQEEKHLFDSGFNNSEIRNFENELIAGASMDWKDEVLSDSSGIEVLPNQLLPDFEEKLKKKLFIEAFSLLVPVQYWQYSKLEYQRIHNVLVVNASYSSYIGLSINPDDPADNELTNTATCTPANVI